MKTNLSSQITLTRIPVRFYRPENAYEQSILTQYENIPTTIYESAEEGSRIVAAEIAALIAEKQREGKSFVMGLPGGRSPQSLYRELIRMHKEEGLSFANVVVFNLYEFYPLVSTTFSNLTYLKNYLLDHVDISHDNIHSPNGQMPKEQIYDFCIEYEKAIENAGGLDYVILGLGHAGTISLNSPGTAAGSSTRFILMDVDSKKEASTQFKNIENVPVGAITLSISTILKSKQVVMMAWGDRKANILRKAVEGKETDSVPASYLQNKPNARLVTDLSGAYSLTRISHPWLVTNCEWDNKLIRRAIVWLCHITGKPILKLTNKDYSEHGLEGLLARYGSAYAVNIQIFNDIQHTITGWPGGKPNADDSNRPERATPFPKKVIIFSPHPDDDVISMGGTFRRLCDQGHDVYVAYQTSGNIAVGDEEVVRYCEYLRDVCDRYSPDSPSRTKAEEIIRYLHFDKKAEEREHPDVLFMKGTIRREEARAAARYCGVTDDSRIRFLDLPFYETGMVKKNDISKKDVRIILELLDEIKPDQIFVAGDLADPHGTHKVCLDAVLAAVDSIKKEPWMKQCRIWMYRGAWAEWEMDHIEMAVPLSPEELRHKRNAILKHQSQAESAPFLGNDERLFWQRAEDRNRSTAELYRQLGLAAYEAIEAFVRYNPNNIC
ncbi:MAG: glucosamine-6-phosphate deaminase [Tannerellaceae bacterium]|jgi:glucosamine-6-phosphate deaminase|nr:glucosamine-6-phosphate deaminase [Tannerellaceae bacterium]